MGITVPFQWSQHREQSRRRADRKKNNGLPLSRYQLFQQKNYFQIGHTVGYQIRLESRVSPKTLLTFCTNGVLLRSLMGGEANALGTLTHVIVDEVSYRPFCLLHTLPCRSWLVFHAHNFNQTNRNGIKPSCSLHLAVACAFTVPI